MTLAELRALLLGAAMAFMASAIMLVLSIGTPAAFQSPVVVLLWTAGAISIAASGIVGLMAIRRKRRLEVAGSEA